MKLGRSCGVLSLELSERIYLQMLDEGVEFLLGLFIFISLAVNSNSDLSGHVSDALTPKESVKSSIDTHVLNGKYGKIPGCTSLLWRIV